MAEYMESPGQPEDPKPPKPYASVAQIKRCDGLVAEGKIAKEIFERDLIATNLEGLIWRKGPAKEEDGTPEQQAAYVAELQGRKDRLMKTAFSQAGEAEGGVLLFIVGFAFLFAISNFVSCSKCNSRAEKMGMKCSYGPIEGCMLQTKKGWIPMAQYRDFGD